jgi:membrane protein DedA with SNARE-associated domain
MDLLHIITKFGYPSIFLITIVEGPIITVIGGFLASLGIFKFLVVYLMVVTGDMCGDILWYGLGYFGRERFIRRYGHYFGITEAHEKSLERYFNNHSGKTIFLAKITHAIGLPFIIAAGLSRVSFKKFFLISLLATLPKSLVFLLAGYYLGSSYQNIDRLLTQFTIAVIFAVGLLGLLFYLKSRFKDRFN